MHIGGKPYALGRGAIEGGTKVLCLELHISRKTLETVHLSPPPFVPASPPAQFFLPPFLLLLCMPSPVVLRTSNTNVSWRLLSRLRPAYLTRADVNVVECEHGLI